MSLREEQRGSVLAETSSSSAAEVSSSTSSVLEGSEKAGLPVVATVFDKLNQVYKEYLEAEQSYTAVRAESGSVRTKR